MYKIFVRNIQLLHSSTMNWENLYKLKSVKTVSSMYIWLFLVPLLVKATNGIQGNHTLNIFGSDFQIDFDLPFSWYFFYFSALFFVIGNILVTLFCPQIVKDALDSRVFQYNSKDSFKVVEYGVELGLDIDLTRDDQFQVDEIYVLGVRHRPIIRPIVFLAYLAGLLLITAVVLQNILAVFSMIS